MNVTFYLQIQNGEKFTWVNHNVTKPEEIEWLLKNVKETLEKALMIKDTKDMEDFKKFTSGNEMRKSINKRF